MQTKEWTLMFYFASDNPLASTIVSQLKALKDAGFHPDANVIARFDPHAVKTPVHTFDVNALNKFWYPGQSQVGFVRNNPYVRDLVLDRLWEDDKIRDLVTKNVKGDPGTEFNPPRPSPAMSGEQTPKEALPSFLNFCRDKYPARHYLLFILGHGQVVGNDTLLFDDNAAEHSVKLTELGQILRDFNTSVKREQDEPGVVEMIGLHSCSMSAMEVAYELHDAANYLLASQGPSYVGSWPYKQILLRIFNDLNSRLTTDDINGTHQGRNGTESLLKKLADGEEAAALFVRGELEHDTRTALDAFKTNKQVAEDVIKVVVRDLNQILDDEKIARANAFMHVGATNGISQLRNADLQGVNLRRFNRLLLAEAFPEIARYPKLDIEKLLNKIFYYCVYNSFDFQLAGYPYELCLTNLTKVPETRERINALADSLVAGLKDETDLRARQIIQLAHLDAQSFYQEDYVDLYDFCFSFRNRVKETNILPDSETADGSIADTDVEFKRKIDPDSVLGKICQECKNMMDVLEKAKDPENAKDHLILNAAFSGPAFQYSHGLSIYFPWSEPVADEMWDEHYAKYTLAKNTNWRDFLAVYFERTMRKTRDDEMKAAGLTGPDSRDTGHRGALTDASTSEKVLALIGQVGAHVLAGDGGRLQKPGPDHPTGRFGPDDPTGAACNCATIKNYPPFVGIKENGQIVRGLAVSEDIMAGHDITKNDDPDGA
ncbi:MAG TPA: clostripain-related cysteine peptidase [Pyrinomonadaceae bacterium]